LQRGNRNGRTRPATLRSHDEFAAGQHEWSPELLHQSGDPAINRILIHPGCVPAALNHLGSFNTVTETGRLDDGLKLSLKWL
jgi:hypothetical protein